MPDPYRKLLELRLRPDWHVTSKSTGHVTIGNEQRELKVTAAPRQIDLLTAVLSEPSGSTEIDPLIEDLVVSLDSRGIMTSMPSELNTRDSRTLEYLACFTRYPREAFDRLQQSVVLVLGLGGTGSVVLQNLVAAGLKQFILLDSDTVQESNLNRQFLYSYEDLGKRKVDVCKRYIENRVKDASVTTVYQYCSTERDFKSLIRDNRPDVALVAIDEPVETIVTTATTALDCLQIPYLVAGVGVRRCFKNQVRESGIDDRMYIGTSASIATTNAVSASYAAHSLIEWITKVNLPFEVHEHE